MPEIEYAGPEREMEVTLKFRYRISGNPDRLKQVYGTTDLDECARIDAQNPAEGLLSLAEEDPEALITVVQVPGNETEIV